MMTELLSFYYLNLLESIKFFQGDEGIARDIFRPQIDKKNILTLLKEKIQILIEILSKNILSRREKFRLKNYWKFFHQTTLKIL